MAIEAIKGAGMVYQGSTSTAQIKEQAQGRTEVSSADNQVVSDSIARNIQAMNTKETSGDSAGDAGAQGQAQLAAQKQNEKNMQLKKAVDDINKSVKIQSQEARNKDLMTLKFASIKKQASEVRVGTQAASRYYKSMSGTGYMEPQFMDNKK